MCFNPRIRWYSVVTLLGPVLAHSFPTLFNYLLLSVLFFDVINNISGCNDYANAGAESVPSVTNALSRFNEDSASIVMGRHVVANNLLEKHSDPGHARLMCWSALLRSGLYLSMCLRHW